MTLLQCATANADGTGGAINADLTVTDNSLAIIVAANVCDNGDRIRGQAGRWALCAGTSTPTGSITCGDEDTLTTGTGAIRLSTGCGQLANGGTVASGARLTSTNCDDGYQPGLVQHTTAGSINSSGEVRDQNSESQVCITLVNAAASTKYQLDYQSGSKSGTTSMNITSCEIITASGTPPTTQRMTGGAQ
jgi:hypothetical protein